MTLRAEADCGMGPHGLSSGVPEGKLQRADERLTSVAHVAKWVHILVTRPPPGLLFRLL